MCGTHFFHINANFGHIFQDILIKFGTKGFFGMLYHLNVSD